MDNRSKRMRFLWVACVICTLTLAACSSTGKDPRDPYESFNRKMYAFNNGIDVGLVTPLATIYNGVLPHPVRQGVNNFFSNLGEIPSVVGYLFQGNPSGSLHSAWRLVINSTFGLGGLFDVASRTGIEKDQTDFGITFAKWGDRDAAYFVIPFFGPSTVRDMVGFVYDFSLLTAYHLIDSSAARYSLTGVWFISQRAKIMSTEKILEESTLDKYVLQRDAYLQYRDARIRKVLGEEEIDPYVENDEDEDLLDDLDSEEGDEAVTEKKEVSVVKKVNHS